MGNVFEKSATVEKWDDDYYNPISDKLYDAIVSDMLRELNTPRGEVLLDAGCGPGVHSIRVAKTGHRVCAIDISEKMLSVARQRVHAAGLSDSVNFHRMDLTRLALPDKSVHSAFSWGVVIHIPDAEKALDELARIVKPGGKLALYLTNGSALDFTIEDTARKLAGKNLKLEHRPLGSGVWCNMNDEQLWVWRFNIDAVVNYLKSKDFTLVQRWAGEFSEIQRRLSGPLRSLLLHVNNLAYRVHVPPAVAVANLLIFERKT